MPFAPYDLPGPQFLILYILLLTAAIAAGFLIPFLLRPAGRRQRVTDFDQLAYLAGGARRFRESVVASLLASRHLVMAGRSRFSPTGSDRSGASIGGPILRLPAPIRWRDIRNVLEAPMALLERRLAAAGLVMDRGDLVRARFLATFPYALLFAFGTGKWVVGLVRDRPVAGLTMLLIATAIFAALRWTRFDPRTRAGREAVQTEQLRAERLARAPTSPEVGIAVALFGTWVLTGSGFENFHKIRSNVGGGCGGGGGGCGGGGGGDGCGGGGGCGGGCGGCGG